MPTVIPAGFGLVAVKLRLAGDPEPMFVTHGVDLSEAGVDHQATANAIGNSFVAVTSLGPLFNSSWTVESVILRVGDGAGGSTVFEDAVNYNSGVAGASLPQNCAVLFKKQTNLAGREGRGRMYFPGIAEGNVDAAGVLTSTAITSHNDRAFAYLNLLADDVQTPAPMVLLHSSPQLGAVPPPTVVTAMIVDSRIATQRRRLRR